MTTDDTVSRGGARKSPGLLIRLAWLVLAVLALGWWRSAGRTSMRASASSAVAELHPDTFTTGRI
jgi:hypothetical protein